MSIESVWEIRLRSVRPGLNRAGVRQSPGRGHQLSSLRVDRAPSVTSWSASGIRARARRALDIAAVDDLDCRTLLAKHDSAGIDARDMERHDEHRHCRLSLRHPRPVRRRAAPAPVSPRCRLRSDRAIALASAPSEAAQTRLRYINGIRDDLLPVKYEDQVNLDIIEALLDALHQESGPHLFRRVPSFTGDDLVRDLHWELAHLRWVGITRVIAVDLTRPEFGIPVVRVVIPGLEGDIRHPHCVLGPRGGRAVVPPR